MDGYRNFDAAVREQNSRTTKFDFHGESFEVDLNVKASRLLEWMREASSVEGIPKFIDIFFDADDYERLMDSDPTWDELSELVVWLSKELGGGSGN